MDLGHFNTQCHVQPPLRSQRDRDGLRQGLQRGVFGAVCSDHQPHDADAKLAPFCESESGISAVETLLPLTLRLVEDGLLELKDALAKITNGPAGLLGIEAGTLAVGRPADVCLFDPDRYWTVGPDSLLSRGHNTPFTGWELKGRVTRTLLGGRVVYSLER